MRSPLMPRKTRTAFTLIEMLAVIAIIATLAGLILAALSKAKLNAQRKLCQAEEVGFVGAVEAYYSTYSRVPASSFVVNTLAGSTNDFTYGTTGTGVNIGNAFPSYNKAIVTYAGNTPVPYQTNNAELIAILRDDMWPPETMTSNTMTWGHVYNPQQVSFFQGKPAVATNLPGIGPDEIWRDPWGMPYMVTLDVNGENYSFDPYLNQLYQNGGPSSALMIPGHAVVWSLGPTMQVNMTQPLKGPANKTMVISANF